VSNTTNGYPEADQDGWQPNARDIPTLIVSGNVDAHPLPETPFHEAGLWPNHARGLEAATITFNDLHPLVVVMPLAVDGSPSTPFLQRILARRPAPVVLVVASNDQINAAAEAMRLGAHECLFRPFSPERLSKALESAVLALPPSARPEVLPAQRPAARAATRPVTLPDVQGEPSGLLTASDNMRDLLAQVDALARSDAPVFITGEVGSGKDLIANRLHSHAPRARFPFVAIECALLTQANADERFIEECERARGGTLYLNDVSRLSPDVQSIVLNRIAEATESGSSTHAPRIVSATSLDPLAPGDGLRLRPDLFYRLHVVPLDIPPLRDRPNDIGLIARTKLADFARAGQSTVVSVSAAAMACLEAHDWPGNVRELVNVIWSAVAMHDGPELLPEHLPPEIARAARRSTLSPLGLGSLIGQPLAEIERAVIEATIRAEGGSIPLAARVLDVAPSTIYRKRDAWAKLGNRIAP
jgi:DNA-binding NtrC family response regulator